MTLDEFFKECERKGAIPLSYRSHVETLNGSQTIEYENPKYREAKAKLARMLGSIKQTGNPRTDNLLSRLYGEEIVIHTKDGYHFGRLQGYDGKSFMLGDYLFNDRPMEMMDYETEFFHGGDTIIPTKDIISISKIPDMVEEFA
jgi:small nuclear ribonucleoprotein (snRNP)-like protein